MILKLAFVLKRNTDLQAKFCSRKFSFSNKLYGYSIRNVSGSVLVEKMGKAWGPTSGLLLPVRPLS